MAISIDYSIGKTIDLRKLKRFGIKQEDENFAFTRIGNLFFIIFKNGIVRVVHADRTMESLKKDLMMNAPLVKELISKIISASGIRRSVDEVMASGKESSEVIIARPTLKGNIDIDVFREISIRAPEIILGEYQRERLSAQAGDVIGRKIGKGCKSKNELVKKIIEYMRKSGLGVAQTMKPKKEKSGRTPYEIFVVKESAFSYGTVPVGKPVCEFIRALIRGAFCEYLNRENVSVSEVRCWGLGDVFCEFRVYLV